MQILERLKNKTILLVEDEKIIRENNTKGNFEILLKIQGLLNEIK